MAINSCQNCAKRAQSGHTSALPGSDERKNDKKLTVNIMPKIKCRDVVVWRQPRYLKEGILLKHMVFMKITYNYLGLYL